MRGPPPGGPLRVCKPAAAMTTRPPSKPRDAVPASPDAAAQDDAALLAATRAVLEPLAALAVARGVMFASIEELLKTAFVDAARAAHANAATRRDVSRISTVTGLNRREVTRITQTAAREAAAPRQSPATRLFTRWLADPALKDKNGAPRALPRLGPAPSFESLAQAVTQDVHARSLLDELCRLGLARVEGETVQLTRASFVPKSDDTRMLGFLGTNVGDHLRAAVANVVADEPQHLEQAVFASELSQDSLDALRAIVRTQWQSLLASIVPTLQQMIDADQAAGKQRDRRVRVGLYTYQEPIAAPSEAKRGASSAKSGALPKPARKPVRRTREG